jgi:hypothetical protein
MDSSGAAHSIMRRRAISEVVRPTRKTDVWGTHSMVAAWLSAEFFARVQKGIGEQ